MNWLLNKINFYAIDEALNLKGYGLLNFIFFAFSYVLAHYIESRSNYDLNFFIRCVCMYIYIYMLIAEGFNGPNVTLVILQIS